MQKQHFIIIDLILVAIFATIGRVSHGESLVPAGIVHTAWPFMTALLVAWVVLLVRKRPTTTLGAGVFVWLVTVVGGMLLRRWTGEGTAVPFIVVATVVLAVFLIGWRLLWVRLDRRSTAG
ncbi:MULTISPECIES: DUF3054 domain-containing protein [Aestuariimicrobium]|uniref:DUF3054 domain-containing protein n=1 Tax=Aestuariimicrobium TaxID=396388 RepID=UPI0003B65AA3|nr:MULTISPECIES: DUF3054 domain-containing protein [Aestuariimicrobium]CAI9409838.1 hypothetical protein AESSP_02316 [Aestuariimicrobium sp. T2.26MG-19.2B]